MGLEFFLPFIIPILVAILGAILDSVLKEGQQLDAEEVLLPFKGLGKVIFQFGKYMYHFYLGCFAFDVAALVPFISQGESLSSVSISYFNKPLVYTLGFMAIAIVFHILAYVHTLIITRDFEQGKAKRPITYLHLFYFPISVILLFLVRW